MKSDMWKLLTELMEIAKQKRKEADEQREEEPILCALGVGESIGIDYAVIYLIEHLD